MTDEQIIKAYECCSKTRCSECPMELDPYCVCKLNNEITDLINRQKAKIDFLQSSKNLHEAEFKSLKLKLDLAKSFHQEAVAERNLINLQLEKAELEIERLKLENKKEKLYNLRMTAHSVKTEAFKEFAERLCEDWRKDEDEMLCDVDIVKWILDTYKEMAGAESG